MPKEKISPYETLTPDKKALHKEVSKKIIETSQNVLAYGNLFTSIFIMEKKLINLEIYQLSIDLEKFILN
jgi:hypothetical protein